MYQHPLFLSAQSTMPSTPFILLDNARENRARYYHHHHQRSTLTADKLDVLDHELQQGFAQGLHATLRLPYEFGRDLIGLSQNNTALIIDWWRQLDHLHSESDIHHALEPYIDPTQPRGQLLNLHLDGGKAAFTDAVLDIQEKIRAGTVYQINHTARLRAEFSGDPTALYLALRQRQPAPYAAYAYHPEDGHTLCLSPELFLHLQGTTLHTQPMKGTAVNPDNERERATAINALHHDPKNRAENAMIVDLLRNDFSKLAAPHSVKVKDAFKVDAHGSVLQMTTRVEARLRPDITFADILRATFPCGSITGAPKRMAMQCIHELEHGDPRGLYTGALGYIEPQASGGYHATLNVAIRTLCLQHGQATFGSGGGITIDSDPEAEYQELCDKAAFLQLPASVGLIETFAIAHGIPQRFDAHLHRLSHSAHALNIPFHRNPIQLPPTDAPYAMGRITLSPHGELAVSVKAIEQIAQPIKAILYPTPFANHAPLRQHKTDHRAAYQAALNFAQQHDAFDAILCNADGYLLEGARSNLFLKLDGQWHTPALDLHLLNGIMRQTVLDNPELIGATHIQESHLPIACLANAEQILLTNSLRGILPTELITPNTP